MVVVYGTPLYTKVNASVIQPLKLAQNIAGKTVTIPIKILIISANSSIRSFIENNYVDCIHSTDSRVYVESPFILTPEQLQVLNVKLQTLSVDLKLPELRTYNQKFEYTIVETLPSVPVTLKKFKNIHLHYAYYSDGAFTYINMSSKANSIDANEDVIHYAPFKDRNVYTTVHGHVNVDGSVNIFNYFPVTNTYDVYMLDSSQYRTINDNIAQLVVDDNFIFYLISHNSLSCPNKAYNYICNKHIDRLRPCQIRKAYEIFSENGFHNVYIDHNCMYAYDSDAFMYTGVIDDAKLGSFAKYFAQIN